MAKILTSDLESLTDGEKEALEVLKNLPDNWYVVPNKIIVRPNASTREIDFIVIGERNIFVIEEKSWAGTFTGNQTHWYTSTNNQRPSPLNQSDYNGKIVHGILTSAIEGLQSVKKYFVHSLVLLTRAQAIPNIPDDPRVEKNVVLLPGFLSYLMSMDANNGSPWLKLHSANIWKYLTGLSGRPKQPKRFGPYIISGEPKTRPGVKYWEVIHEHTNEKRMLTVYDLTGPFKEKKEFYLNEYKAINALSELNLAPAMFDPLYDDAEDRYFAIPSELPTGVPLDKIPSEVKENTVEELTTWIQALRSMQEIHKRNIIHRFINPGAIYVHLRENETYIQYTEFCMARSPGESTISQYLDDLSIEDPYAAPELKYGYQTATEKSDLFSLCLIFLERIAEIPEGTFFQDNPDISLSHIDLPENLEEDLLSIFEMCLQSQVTSRPTVSEVIKKMESILEAISDNSKEVDNDGKRQSPPINISSPVELPHHSKTDHSDQQMTAGEIKEKFFHKSFWIHMEISDGKSTWHRIKKEGVLIGRHIECDLSIDDPLVSRLHANIELSNESVVIVDLDSQNGTFVDGHLIEKLKEVGNGAVVEIGNTKIHIVSGEIQSPKQSSHLSLEVLSGKRKGMKVIVNQKGTVVGRSENSGLFLPDPGVSRSHAIITYEHSFPDKTEKFFVEDLGSRNGTNLNGNKVNKTELTDGKILFGTVEMNCSILIDQEEDHFETKPVD